MKKFFLQEELLTIIKEHACRDYPKECCGLILGPLHEERLTRVRTFRNLQDEYHAKDPIAFPRTSQTAYWMDPAALLKLQKEMRSSEEEIKIIYHSHIDAGAHFSEEDQRMALSGGTPVYPDVNYLVLSVREGEVQELSLFQWDPALKVFTLGFNRRG